MKTHICLDINVIQRDLIQVEHVKIGSVCICHSMALDLISHPLLR